MTRDELRLSFRCGEDWSAMSGEGPDRHCNKCAREVIDLSERTPLGARWTLATTPEPCVRYAVRPDGRVRFRPGWRARLLAAVGALLPTRAVADEAPDETPPPGEVHLCSTGDEAFVVGMLVGRRGLRIPWRRLLRRPHGDAAVHLAFDPGRWDRAAVRCEGSELPRRAPVEDGEVLVEGLPIGGDCRVRLTGDDRPLTIAFVAGDDQAEIAVRR